MEDVHTAQEIFFSCAGYKEIVREHFIPEHGITYIFSGELKGHGYVYKQGDTVLFRRNQLVKVVKYPTDNIPYKSITIFFTQAFLQAYYTQHIAAPNIPPVNYILFDHHPLLESLFHSLLPYFEVSLVLPQELISLKLQEAITILRTIDKSVDNILAEFAAPGKIDLVAFMEKNYSFNVPISRFSYLTGRSLATFKRDFQKAFNTSPQKWLIQKRLQQAHYLIGEKKQKPTDVYLEVGFENLSHFSTCFKQTFGYNPSSL